MANVAPLTASQEDIMFRRRGIALTLESSGMRTVLEYDIKEDMFTRYDIIERELDLYEVDANGNPV
ncbi:hypothetical protein BBO_09480 [Beauveria brongniartii RCEF 3172]|uniref:Uncharacterized protein n=1 Tax=Beauveria brongniartii RCEF 3172 TaxID=1081107 RepID=A0A168FDI6_9HYPO|nr:hypothetical protein BBO_09480 [Beauveria brongniartii RCEF 3172]